MWNFPLFPSGYSQINNCNYETSYCTHRRAQESCFQSLFSRHPWENIVRKNEPIRAEQRTPYPKRGTKDVSQRRSQLLRVVDLQRARSRLRIPSSRCYDDILTRCAAVPLKASWNRSEPCVLCHYYYYYYTTKHDIIRD